MSDDKDPVDQLIEHEERMRRQVYVTEGHVVINVSYEYNIPLNRCDSLDKILSWVVHLCEKTWITPDVLERFAHVAAAEHGLNIPNA